MGDDERALELIRVFNTRYIVHLEKFRKLNENLRAQRVERTHEDCQSGRRLTKGKKGYGS